jgi:RNA polymerase sigma factor (sigma-70 family)
MTLTLISLEEEHDDEISALYRKCAGRVQAFLINIGCDRGLAEEITNDAFLGARRRWPYVRTLQEPEGYVFKIARNERSKRQKKHDGHAKDLHPNPSGALRDVDDDPAQDIADRAVVRKALDQLPPSQREAVTLRHVVGLSEAATAAVMGVSAGSVKRYTSEGRQKLRLLLAEFRGRREGNDQ